MRVRMLAAVALAALVTTGATGCGDGSGQDGDSGQDPTMDPTSAAVEWAECMREHGVGIPDPKDDGEGDVVINPGAGPGAGADPEAFKEAQDACKEYAEQMGGTGDGTLTEEDEQRMLDFAECMREHGVDMPDPDLDGGDGQQGLTLPDPDDPGYQEATEACRDFVPEGL